MGQSEGLLKGMYIPLVGEIGRMLQEQNEQIAVAESCTGGALGTAFTDVRGSSAFFWGGVIAYSNTAKMSFLGVREDTLMHWGAVSALTAQEMAQGIQEKAGVEYGLAITGIAGPDGGSEEKPVGLVYIALASSQGCWVQQNHFPGKRVDVRRATLETALSFVLDHLKQQSYPEKG